MWTGACFVSISSVFNAPFGHSMISESGWVDCLLQGIDQAGA